MAASRRKILLVEDDRETAKLIANELSERGFYVVIAYEARVGLAATLKRIPDLVLCDVGLPEMTGFEILATVNKATFGLRRIPFIFLTGWSSREDELKGRILGADDYVTKPIDFDILEEIINARLTKGVARHELPAKLSTMVTSTPTRAPLKTAPEHIFELMDAPMVGWDPDHAIAAPERSDQAADAACAPAPDLVSKPPPRS